jgi:sugar-specific transcriptional regulator TrmB
LRTVATVTGINRGSVYESVKALAEQGMVGFIEVGKQRRYKATDPKVILELLKERQVRALRAEQAADTYIEELQQPNSYRDMLTEVQFATYYEDNEGIAAILRDVIATCRASKIDYRVISTQRLRQHLYQNFPNFTQRRIAEGINVRVIAVGAGGEKDALSDRKWLPAKRGEAPNCYTIVYGNKVAFISMNETNVLSGILIENAGVAQLQKELFEQLWSSI